MKNIKVTFSDGNVIHTSINGTEKEIRAYYLNNYFTFSVHEDLEVSVKAIRVEFL